MGLCACGFKKKPESDAGKQHLNSATAWQARHDANSGAAAMILPGQLPTAQDLDEDDGESFREVRGEADGGATATLVQGPLELEPDSADTVAARPDLEDADAEVPPTKQHRRCPCCRFFRARDRRFEALRGGDGRSPPDLEDDDEDALPQEQQKILRALREGDYDPWEEAEHLRGNRAFVLRAVAANGLALEEVPRELKADKEIVLQAVAAHGFALQYATQELQGDKEFVLQAVAADGSALRYATQELQADKEFVLQAVACSGWALEYASQELKADKEVVAAAVRRDPEALGKAAEALRGSPDFVKRLVKETKAWWLVEWATEELRQDPALRKECQELCGTGLVFTYYQNGIAFAQMRDRFKASGASVPGGEAYEPVMEKLREDPHGSTATVWFGETLVFGSFADNGTWVHPPYACGRDNTPVPPPAERDRMWQSCVESQRDRKDPEVGSRYPCWCCHWLKEVQRQHQDGAVICISVSNIYKNDWVEKYNAGSSELSDADAERLGLPKEEFVNGKPSGWGEGSIRILGPFGGTFERKAPIHPHMAKPLGTGCRWERSVLDRQCFPVYAFFMP